LGFIARHPKKAKKKAKPEDFAFFVARCARR
jgi:hypothetical protein